jgi:Ataxin-3
VWHLFLFLSFTINIRDQRTQLGFILNLQQHWFALRRFGNASADVDQDEGNGHWFNLNSFLSQPEWVGKLYLGMVLQQAETEG